MNETTKTKATPASQLRSDRLTIMETAHTRETALGPMRCVAFNAWCTADVFPTVFAASGLLVYTNSGWLLSYIAVEDEGRRNGFATEIVRFYEDRLGELGACWATDASRAFARKYIERFGPRPHWQIEPNPHVERMIDQLIAEREYRASHNGASQP